jgi:hypothetical protein
MSLTPPEPPRRTTSAGPLAHGRNLALHVAAGWRAGAGLKEVSDYSFGTGSGFSRHIERMVSIISNRSALSVAAAVVWSAMLHSSEGHYPIDHGTTRLLIQTTP